MKVCGQVNIPTVNNDYEGCLQSYDTDCVIYNDPIPYFGTTDPSTTTEVFDFVISSLIDARSRILILEGLGAPTDHGDLTGLGDDDHTQYLTENRGRALLLTGLNDALTGDIEATDSVLEAFGKIQNGLPNWNTAFGWGDHASAGYLTATLIDDDTFATATASNVASAESIKAYVDSQVGSGASGLETLDEGNGIGWRLIGRNPSNFGNIGLDAIDMSYSSGASSTKGATGGRSFTAAGINLTASGLNSVVVGGAASEASGTGSGVIGGVSGVASGSISFIGGGNSLYARGYGEAAVGIYNTDYTPINPTSPNPSDRIFSVGNGTATNVRRDAFTVFQNGLLFAPSAANVAIDSAANSVLITKGWFNANASGGTPTGLELISEGGNEGWRFIGADPADYGDIGDNAVDLSYSLFSSSTRGATGDYAVSMGLNNTASGLAVLSWGQNTDASGEQSAALGRFLDSPSFSELTVGLFATTYTPASTSGIDAADRVFTVGNGTNGANRSDALKILKGGEVFAPSMSEAQIDAASDDILITKEWFNANVGGGGATNLSWNAATSQVESSTGTNATISIADDTNPGLVSREEHNISFTPTLTDEGGGATYSIGTSSCFYSRVGPMVFFTITLGNIQTTGTPTGDVIIGNLPFTAARPAYPEVGTLNYNGIDLLSASALIRGGFDTIEIIGRTLSTEGIGLVGNILSALTITNGTISISGVYITT